MRSTPPVMGLIIDEYKLNLTASVSAGTAVGVGGPCRTSWEDNDGVVTCFMLQ